MSRGDQRNTIRGNMRGKHSLQRSSGDGCRTGIHEENIVRTRGAFRLPLIGSTFMMTRRRRRGRKAVLKCTSSSALGVTNKQGRGK